MVKRVHSMSISLLLAGALVGCGGSNGEPISGVGGGNDKVENPQKETSPSKNSSKIKTVKGNVIDAPVWGLEYSCKGQSTNTTDENGAFECVSLPVTFRVGNVIVGSVSKMPSDNKVFPQDIVGVSRDKINDQEVEKLASFLQTLDDDGNIEGSIKIDEALRKKLKDKKDIHLVDLSKVKIAKMIDKELVKFEDAIKHLKKNIFTDKKPDSIEIKLSKDTLPLGLDGDAVINGIYTLGDGEIKSIISKGISFKSSDKSIALIDKSGKIVTKKEGKVDITAIYSDMNSTTTLTVSGVALVDINITNPKNDYATMTNLALGRSVPLRAIGVYSDKNLKKDVTSQIRWSSKSPIFSNISPNTTQLSATGEGLATLTATLLDVSKTMELDVKKHDIRKVKINLNEVKIPKGRVIDIYRVSNYSYGGYYPYGYYNNTLLGLYADDSNTSIDTDGTKFDQNATWSLDNENILKIESYSGGDIDIGWAYGKRLIAKEKGEVILTAKYKNLEDNLKITVVDPVMEYININRYFDDLTIGDKIKLSVQGVYSDGRDENLTGGSKLIFKSLNPSIFTVTSDGNLTALKEGSGEMMIIYTNLDRNITSHEPIFVRKTGN